jgi:predicted negative regulator of RcsB-dependent stress response
MFKIKREKSETAGPSQVIGSMGQVADVARENLTGVIVSIMIVLVVAAAVGGFLWMRQQEERAAEDLLNEAMQIVVQGAPVPMPPSREQLQKASETFRKVLSQYSRTSVAPQASYMLGNVLSDLKDWEGAGKAYQDFLNRYGDQKALIPFVYQRLAYAQLSQGKVEEAEKTLDTITKLTGAKNKDHALYELAKIDEVLNRPEGALAHYQQLMKEHPHSPYAEEASIRVKTLDARKSMQPAGGPLGIPPTATPAPQATVPAPSKGKEK